MTKARTLADFISDGSPLADGTISVAEVSGAAPLANPTFTGAVTSPQINLVNPHDSGKVLVLDVDQGDVISVGDLEIYDDRTSGIGYMLRTDTSTQAIGADAVVIMDRTGQKSLANFAYSGDTGTAKLRYWDSNGGYDKLSTSLAGISVVGTVTADGLNVGGSATFNEGGADVDFRVESDTNANMLFVDGGINAVQVGSSTVPTSGGFQSPALYVKGTTTGIYGITHFEAQENDSLLGLGHVSGGDFVFRTSYRSTGAFSDVVFEDYHGNSVLQLGMKSNTAETVFNNTGVDHDFRVESDANFACFFVDAGNGKIGINQDVPGYTLDVVGGTNGNTDGIALRPLNESQTLIYSFLGMRNTYFTHFISDSGNTGSSDYFKFFASTEDAAGELLMLDGGGTTFNEGGADRDFRVESDAFSSALAVEGSSGKVNVAAHFGIGKTSAGEQQSAGSGFFFVPGSSGYYSHISTIDTPNFSSYFNRKTQTGGFLNFAVDNAGVGSVTYNGSATVYGTSSDERLKENIEDADDAGSKIDAMQVRKFDWKRNGRHQEYGMVAQELLPISPDSISQGETEEDMMSVDYSTLVPMLIKEIQSLRARVADLES